MLLSVVKKRKIEEDLLDPAWRGVMHFSSVVSFPRMEIG